MPGVLWVRQFAATESADPVQKDGHPPVATSAAVLTATRDATSPSRLLTFVVVGLYPPGPTQRVRDVRWSALHLATQADFLVVDLVGRAIRGTVGANGLAEVGLLGFAGHWLASSCSGDRSPVWACSRCPSMPGRG